MADLTKLPQPSAPCLPAGVTDQHGKDAFTVRFGTATKEAVPTGSVSHTPNTDLTNFPDGLGTYTKALKQASPGIVDPTVFNQFLKACGLKAGGPVARHNPKRTRSRAYSRVRRHQDLTFLWR